MWYSVFIWNPLPICSLLEQHRRKKRKKEKTRKPIKLLQMNEDGRWGKDREREWESKKMTDGNQAVGEFYLDKAGKWKPVFLKHHKVHSFVTRIYCALSLCQVCSRSWWAAAAALTGMYSRPEKPVSTEIKAHIQRALGAVKETPRMPWACMTGRSHLDQQVMEGTPELVKFALERNWEPLEGGWKWGQPEELMGVLSIRTRPQRQREEKVELLHWCPRSWNEKS